MRLILTAAVAVLVLAGCTERPADLGENRPPEEAGALATGSGTVAIAAGAPVPTAIARGVVPGRASPGVVQGKWPVKAKAAARLLPAGAANLNDVRSVELDLSIEQAAGPLGVVLELTAPGGVHYERRERAIRVASGEVAHVLFNLPVAGTVAQQNALAGTWNAEFLVDGIPVATTAFTLQP